MKRYGEGNVPIATGSVGNYSDKVWVYNHNKNNISIPTNITYNIANDTSLSFLRYLDTQCSTPKNGGDRSIALNLTVDLHFTMLAFTKQVPTIHTSVNFDCPVDPADVPKIPGTRR
ncbi:hypothetical protein HK101_003693 [Irineochytrium annulatum]|nr:hypothetical protein HK101_003693 [Irineochytrium annulatum]